MKQWKLTVALLLLFSHAAHADDAVRQAKAFFARYVKLEAAYDPAGADLYADEAFIRNIRRYPTGQTRVMTLTGKQYKPVLRLLMPVAKASGDKNRYSQVTYQRVGKKVKITGKRYSLLKKYTSPITIIIAPSASKKWLIVEEHTETRP